MYKGKKYNAVLIFLVIIISFVVGISTGMSAFVPPFEEVVDNPDGGGYVGDTDLPPGAKKPGADAGAYERLAFAFKVLEDGKGFTAYAQQAIDIIGNTQYTYYKRYRSGDYDVSEEWHKLGGPFASIGKNYFLGTHSDGVIMRNFQIDNPTNYSYDAKTYNVERADSKFAFTVDHWLNERNNLRTNDFMTPVSKDTSTILSYDGKAYNKTHYTIKVAMNINKLDKKLVAIFNNMGAASVIIKTVTMEFKIDKKTGFFTGYEIKALFNASYIGINADVPLQYKENFTSMNNPGVKAQIDSLYDRNFKDIN